MNVVCEYTLKLNLLRRRREMLKMHSLGFTRSEMLKDLEPKYHVSQRALYYDWRNRKKWAKEILEIQDPETFFYDVISRYQELWRLCSRELLTGDNSSARIGAIRTLVEINRAMAELIITQDLLIRVDRLESKKDLNKSKT